MAKEKVAAVILAAGQGTRMKSAVQKVMHAVAGRPLLAHVVAAARAARCAPIVAVVAPHADAVAEAAAPAVIAVQRTARGTGHAVMCARRALAGFSGTVLALLGDVPLVTPATIRRLLAARRRADAAVAVLGFRPRDAGAYGRLIVTPGNRLAAIVERRDATPAQRKVSLCNSGVIAIDGARLWTLLDALRTDNARGEYYLTDIVAEANRRNLSAIAVEGPEDELVGINSRAELAAAEAKMQARLRAAALERGVALQAPDTVFFSYDTRLGRDVRVGPYVVFGPGVSVEAGAEIRAFSHLEGARVARNAVVGPFARLRPGARIGRGAHVGNFVEIKQAAIGAGAKANHLSYIGDATVGARANIGAGTITCNYDGFEKYRTVIGAGAFIGSDTALVAPVKVGDGAITAAGSVITDNVPAQALAVARGRQRNVAGWAKRFRARRRSR